ncbi:TfoX/Sxy family protein [Curvivirga aplysinae]|uniref:TfoX/Sxy family protein n=1 Tax=Curvivirga aplysinae TaxID=2529852 RepID=UPI0012BB5FBF|nr:TfoX/Sxy family protein [Curvivirga aplysinae]MTI10856.1 competence protein TfoX [Curvivirga aplysinae]
MRNVEELKNIGSKTGRFLREVNIYTENDLRDFGVEEAFHRVFFRFQDELKFSSVFLYALEGALMDIHWNDIPQKRKNELKVIFKKICCK